MVSGSLAAVANQLESANHLANGEEAEALGEDDTTSSDLDTAEIPGLVEEVLGGLKEGPVLDGLQCVLVVGLEGRDGGRAHLLAMEDDLGNLGGDLGVVDDEGDLSLDKSDDSPSSSTNLLESIAQSLGIAGNGRASSRRDARQALLRLGRGVLGSVLSLLSGVALEAAGGQAHGRGAEHGTRERLHFGRSWDKI